MVEPSSTKSNMFKLIIKAANQKFEDFVIESCELDWSVKHLKQYLHSNYPKNPNVESIRLIYSGKLLHDHFVLKDCIRHNSEINSHIIHLVHSAGNLKNSQEKENEDNETDVDNELTPSSSFNSDSAPSSGSSTSTSSSSNIGTSSPNVFESSIFNFFQQQPPSQQNQTQLTEKQKYEQTLQHFTNYYQTVGIPVQSHAWYSAYVQHLALYSHMYSNYINYLNASVGDTNPSNIGYITETVIRHGMQTETQNGLQTRPSQMPQQEPEQPVVQPPAEEQRAPQQQVRNQANNELVDREDDWLSILHNLVSFFILLSIVYYYSSLERFLVIFAVVLVLICYQNGWLSLQRRRVNQPVNNEDRRNQNVNENRVNEQNENLDQNSNREDHPENVAQQPNIIRLIISFVFTFFTSLIPERPRILN